MRTLSFWLFSLSMALGSAGFSANPDVTLRSLYARNDELSDLVAKAPKAAVFAFFKPGCPVVELSIPELKSLHETYRQKGIEFYAIYSYSGLNVRSMAVHAQEFDIPFRIFLDVDEGLAKFWDVKRTGEVVFVDKNQKILYRGAITDADRSDRTEGRYLANALKQFTEGAPITLAQTKGQGCLINKKPPTYLTSVTWYKDILPIVQEKCQKCHRSGEIGPMPLMTYEDASSFAPMIEEVVRDRIMPPWPAESPRKIKDDNRLTPDQIRKILSWVENDTPEGNPADAPIPKVWPDPEAWEIGTPDAVFQMRPFTVPAQGVIPYIYTRVDLNLPEDRYIEALEVKPGARRAVHHIAVHEFPFSDSGISPIDIIKMKGLELSDEILGAYVPGITPRIMEPGNGTLIRKGMGLLLEGHYTPFGKEAVDVSRVAFKFCKTPPKREVRSKWFYRSRGRFLVPAGVDHLRMERDDISFDNDIEILGLRPHLHARGKDFLVEKVWLDETGKERSETLLSVPRWDFGWQMDYMFEEPIPLKGGESLRIVAHWDNTDFNPFNPDPKLDVPFGEQTDQEMMGVLVIHRDALPKP